MACALAPQKPGPCHCLQNIKYLIKILLQDQIKTNGGGKCPLIHYQIAQSREIKHCQKCGRVTIHFLNPKE